MFHILGGCVTGLEESILGIGDGLESGRKPFF